MKVEKQLTKFIVTGFIQHGILQINPYELTINPAGLNLFRCILLPAFITVFIFS